jgi:hypothetical protein
VDREASLFSSAAELARHVKKCSDSRGDAFCSREKVWNIVRIAIEAWSVEVKLSESEDGGEVVVHMAGIDGKFRPSLRVSTSTSTVYCIVVLLRTPNSSVPVHLLAAACK